MNLDLPMHMGVPKAYRNNFYFIATPLIFQFWPSLGHICPCGMTKNHWVKKYFVQKSSQNWMGIFLKFNKYFADSRNVFFIQNIFFTQGSPLWFLVIPLGQIWPREGQNWQISGVAIKYKLFLYALETPMYPRPNHGPRMRISKWRLF